MNNLKIIFFQFSLIERQKQSNKLLNKYPERVPIVIYTNNSDIIIKKNKYLADKKMSFLKFITIIRKNIDNIKKNDGLFFLINNKIMVMNENMEYIYEKEKNEDGFLYLYIFKEDVFG